ncbi:hypothetical protein CYLTODRAFT_492026 [Cylindrobasidium torrendii FP15055 ss-10]|uniref:Uncharacterized protein n=1 Tax=Cylindrobasidium torrendii FP15055 ss-10 TaxID=1314674 RepID=A0A0D7B8D9_9AGAR|nr:hypothetical protein CYLTODRAFT_492026 [Cylindrobasidium torrendii FP15055 ss-10]
MYAAIGLDREVLEKGNYLHGEDIWQSPVSKWTFLPSLSVGGTTASVGSSSPKSNPLELAFNTLPNEIVFHQSDGAAGLQDECTPMSAVAFAFKLEEAVVEPVGKRHPSANEPDVGAGLDWKYVDAMERVRCWVASVAVAGAGVRDLVSD